jgi:outer membrane protein assembly factor BamE
VLISPTLSLPAARLSRISRKLGVLCVAGLLPLGFTACSSVRNAVPKPLTSPETMFGLFKPYRMEVVQGNVITQEVMAQIQPGLGRAQVREILGTPLLADIFHENRWDYVFTIARQGVPAQQRRVSVFFKNNVVERFEADTLPTEREFVASVSRPETPKAPLPDLTPAQIAALPVPAKTEAKASKVPQGASREYPPLEPGRR